MSVIEKNQQLLNKSMNWNIKVFFYRHQRQHCETISALWTTCLYILTSHLWSLGQNWAVHQQMTASWPAAALCPPDKTPQQDLLCKARAHSTAKQLCVMVSATKLNLATEYRLSPTSSVLCSVTFIVSFRNQKKAAANVSICSFTTPIPKNWEAL